MSSKKIYVVLTRSTTVLSQLIHYFKGDEYTHAALAFDRELNYMFSFGRRRPGNPFVGCFKRERLNEGVYKNASALPGVIIEIPVSPSQYGHISGQIETFLLNSHLYSYNYLGLAGNLFNRTHQDSRHFFCSEFVYHVLNRGGVCDLKMPRGRVHPQDLMKLGGEIIFKGNLMEYRQQPDFADSITEIALKKAALLC